MEKEEEKEKERIWKQMKAESVRGLMDGWF